MAFTSRRFQMTLQVILGIIIVGLAYLLYDSIVTPFQEVERQREVTEVTRAQMDRVRQALILYERANNRYVTTLDSLVTWMQEDSTMAAGVDSIFGQGFDVTTLPFSPRTGNRFQLAINDTSQTRMYLLSDPDSDDYIGSLEPDITRLNAASWE